MHFIPIPMTAIVLVFMLQLVATRANVFLPATNLWKLNPDNPRTEKINKTTLSLDENWRSWLLTNSSVTDVEMTKVLKKVSIFFFVFKIGKKCIKFLKTEIFRK